jgi:6-pyruvoyltetrahydropterin/6-carboxytetrahydropterin synthase
MSRITAVRRLQFCAGHRVHRHESKCRHLHGHNYVAFFHAEAEMGLDALGRVIDFGVLKEKIQPWIEANWDHGMVLWAEDLEAIAAVTALPGQKVYTLGTNPTAENMAIALLHDICPRLMADTGVTITRVVLWETENCYAEAALETAGPAFRAPALEDAYDRR